MSGVIQGSMREAPLPDIIQLVSQGNKSGVFHVQMDDHRAKIHLKEGRLVHAVTHKGEGWDALLDVALWLDGSYRFEEGPQEVPTTITRSLPAVLMEMGQRMNEWKVISQKVPSLELYPNSNLLPGEAPQGVNPREAKLFALITGWYSVAELAEVLQRPVLQVAKDLYGLVMAGHVVLKGVRSGRAPKVETPAAPAPPVAASVPSAPDMVVHNDPLEQTAIVRLQAPPPRPVPGFPLADEPMIETVGGGVQGAAPYVPPAAPAAAPQVMDPVRMAKLTAFTQRIAQAAKGVLPEPHHEMVNRLQARATQAIISGEGPEAVKNLALAISKGAVDAGCDAELVRNLNAQLKAIFSK
ncbi:MAG TPA: DUF4388 domain-containing protein [Holophagaceae bacterium]|nr:DUF4388 domain-containing protein [Holophagaceae bacterium]